MVFVGPKPKISQLKYQYPFNKADNHITSLKPLIKLNCPCLTTLSLSSCSLTYIDNNKTRDVHHITGFHSKFLTTITIEHNTTDNNTINNLTKSPIVSINWYFKLESNCSRILISSQSVKNKKILSKLKEKIALN